MTRSPAPPPIAPFAGSAPLPPPPRVAPAARWLGLALFSLAALAAACTDPLAGGPGDGGDPGALDGGARARQPPTGSIAIPTLCGRLGEPEQVTHGGGADSFTLLWDKDHFVLAYSDRGSGDGDLYVIRLTEDGKPLGDARVVAETAAPSRLPSLLRYGPGYVLAWEEGAVNKSVWARALDADAVPLAPAKLVVGTTSSEARPVLAESPAGVALAWMDSVGGEPRVQVGLLADDLSLAPGVEPARLGGRASHPWIVGDDTTLAAAYSEGEAGALSTRFARLEPSLAVAKETSLRQAPNEAILSRIIPTDFGYLTAWEDLRSGEEEIYMALSDTDGVRLAEGLVEEPNTGEANWPHLAWASDAGGIVYYQFRSGAPQVFMSFIDGTGQRIGGGADVQISSSAPGQSARFPDVQWTGQVFGVAWVQRLSDVPEIFFARVSCDRPAPI